MAARHARVAILCNRRQAIALASARSMARFPNH
jgi:hypothetical protein